LNNPKLNINYAISNLDNLKFLEEKKPEGFYCTRFNQEGIIIISNLRISFYYLEKDNEFHFDHMIFAMVNKLIFNITNNVSTLDINYAYSNQRFNFIDKKAILGIKRLAELYIPERVRIDFWDESQQIHQGVLGEKPEEKTDIEAKKTGIIKLKETRPLLFPEKSKFKVPYEYQYYLKKFVPFLVFLTVLYFSWPYISSYKDKAQGTINYGLNFIEFQRVETEVFQIGQATNDYYNLRKKLPEDFSQFIRTSFKTRFSKDSALDPWGSPYRLVETETAFQITSDGPDKKTGTFDDFVKEFAKDIKVPDED
jgi:hypothetical protein